MSDNISIKEFIEQNIELEQKYLTIAHENKMIHKELFEREEELAIYKSKMQDVNNFFNDLEKLYYENKIIEIINKLSSFYGNSCLEIITKNSISNMESCLEREREMSINQNKELYMFCNNYNNIYIYGAGKKAKRLMLTMQKCGLTFDAFVVSDGEKKADRYLEHDVIFLKELINKQERYGLVLGINAINAEMVYPKLKESGISDYFYFN